MSEPVLQLTDAALRSFAAGKRSPVAKLFGPATIQRLERLGKAFGLSGAERGLLLLCAAPELGVEAQELSTLTFTLAHALFDDWQPEFAAPHGALRYWQLLELNQGRGVPLVSSTLSANERVVTYLQGIAGLDQRLTPPLSVEPAVAKNVLSASQSQVCVELERGFAAHSNRRCVAQLAGDQRTVRLYARVFASSVGRTLYRAGAQTLPQHPAELEEFARLWLRECRLAPLALLVELGDADAGGPEEQAAVRLIERYSQLGRSQQLVIVATRDFRPALGAELTAEARRPGPGEQQAAWRGKALKKLGGAKDLRPGVEQATRLARQFNLDLATIRRIVAQANANTGAQADFESALWKSGRAQARPQLSALAQRVEPRARLADLMLPERELGQLRAIIEQVEQRGRVYDEWGFGERLSRGLGVSALFAGPSGTGKTMAAEALADELRLDLYRIDLSGVVSKYIGETEKNLRRLFDAAEDGGAILFFDEAEALFGKRSEVKDSHDRYANIEVGYLLQRMEQYGGLSILATNMKGSLDPAFTRRLRFIIDFPFPAPAQRVQIWKTVWPHQLSQGAEPLDFTLLGSLSLSGGGILNAAQSAAFRAAAQPGGRLTMALVLDAVRDEQRKESRRDDLRPPPVVQRRREHWLKQAAERLGADAAARIDAARLAWFPASLTEIEQAVLHVATHDERTPLTELLIAALCGVQDKGKAEAGGAP